MHLIFQGALKAESGGIGGQVRGLGFYGPGKMTIFE